MNCQPGDLAIVVAGVEVNHGVLVRVLLRSNEAPAEWIVELLSGASVDCGDRVERRPPGSHCRCPDAILRPLRDSDGTDEMLRAERTFQSWTTL